MIEMQKTASRLGTILIELNETHCEADELSEAFYELPPGFKKPKGYPGLQGMKAELAMNKGYVDLGLVDPDTKGLKGDAKLKALILRSVVKLLIENKGENAFIRDPEAVLPVVLGYVKAQLQSHLEEALEAMYDMKITVKVKGVKTKKGVPGWRISAPALAKLVPDA